MIFRCRCEDQDDEIYIQADSEEEARKYLFAEMGPIPDYLLTWTIIKKLPKGEEFL